MNDHLLLGSPPGRVGEPTDSGWTESAVFIKWLKHFVDHVKPTPAKMVVLFVDGHASHKSYEAIEYARANGIEVISFPRHTTQKLQSLDKNYFDPLKQYYGQACDRWMENHSGKRTCFYSIAALFGDAFAKASTLDWCVAGFSSCGLWPFNPDIFTEGLSVEGTGFKSTCCSFETWAISFTLHPTLSASFRRDTNKVVGLFNLVSLPRSHIGGGGGKCICNLLWTPSPSLKTEA